MLPSAYMSSPQLDRERRRQEPPSRLCTRHGAWLTALPGVDVMKSVRGAQGGTPPSFTPPRWPPRMSLSGLSYLPALCLEPPPLCQMSAWLAPCTDPFLKPSSARPVLDTLPRLPCWSTAPSGVDTSLLTAFCVSPAPRPHHHEYAARAGASAVCSVLPTSAYGVVPGAERGLHAWLSE